MTFPLKSLSLGAVALLAACVVQSSRPPIQGGNGVDVDTKTGAVSLDTSEVPVLPSACADGQVVSHTDAGWNCLTLTYADITEAPPVDWTTVAPSVTASTAWPGTLPYAQITDAPADLGLVASDVTTLQTDTSALQTSMTTAEGNITTLQTNVSALQTAKTTDEGNITTLQTNVSALQTAKTTDESNITTLQTNVSALQTAKTTDEGKITTLQTNVSALQTAKTTDEGNITTLQSDVTGLQTSAAAIQHVLLTPGAVGANGAAAQTIRVSGQLKDLSGNNVSQQVSLLVRTLSRTAGQGAIVSVSATPTIINTGAPSGQVSSAVIITAGDGSFEYDVLDTQTGDSVWTEVVLDSGITAGKLLIGY